MEGKSGPIREEPAGQEGEARSNADDAGAGGATVQAHLPAKAVPEVEEEAVR